MEPSRPLWIIKLFSVMDAEYMEIAILKIHYVQKTISFIKLYAFVMLDIQVRLLTTYYFFLNRGYNELCISIYDRKMQF